MRFISPKTDFAFKKIFGSEQSKGILISFLNSILYPDVLKIQDLEILNPYQAPKIRGVKDTYLDVKARLNSGELVIIEMQVLNVEGFEKRILYNAAKAYSIQLGRGQSYSELNPVIALTITDFSMFAEIEDYLSRFILKEQSVLVDYPIAGLELVFVELPKFDRRLDELKTIAEKWIYFLCHAPDFEVVPESMGQVVEIQQAFEMANQAILSKDELEELEHQLIFIQDQKGAVTRATKEALKQGRKEGREEGILENTRSIALNMLRKQLPLETIVEVTGLTIEEIEKIRTQ